MKRKRSDKSFKARGEKRLKEDGDEWDERKRNKERKEKEERFKHRGRGAERGGSRENQYVKRVRSRNRN